MEKRKENYDNMKGVLILLVVLGHLLFSFSTINSHRASILTYFIFTFHMPLFMMITGFFSKKKTKPQTYGKWIIYFLLMNLSFSIYDWIETGTFELFTLKYSSWYLFCLILYKLLYDWKLRDLVTKHKKESLILSFIGAIGIGLFPLPLTICRIFEYLLFFNVGLLYEEKKDKKKEKAICFGITIFLFLILAFLSYKLPVNIYFYMGNPYTNKVEFFQRIGIYLTNIFLFYSLTKWVPNKKIPLINTFGKHSLTIYVLHRIPTLVITNYMIAKPNFIKWMGIISILICIVFSLKSIVNVLEKIVELIEKSIQKKPAISVSILSLLAISLIVIDLQTNYKINVFSTKISDQEQQELNDSVTIGFLGDLLLLEDQLEDSKTEDGYDFSYMFSYTKDYIEDTTYTIGVLEGPSDDTQDYSVGNFLDGKELRVNFPTQFLKDIKSSGIDLVTTSTNHVYDRGYQGAIHTMENLEKIGLDYVGSARGKDNKKKIVEVEGIKLGIVSYTYFTNYGSEDEDVVDRICGMDSPDFPVRKKAVEQDIKDLREEGADLVIVLPHYGTQFYLDFDSFQKTWNDIFVNAGADIVFGDHSHAVGPIKYQKGTLLLGSPGNYVNSYIARDGDLSMYVKVYIDRKTKKIKATSAIPMLAMKQEKGYFPVPLYDIDKIGISGDVTSEVRKIFGKTVLHEEDIQESKEYFIKPYHYQYKNDYLLTLQEKEKESTIYQTIAENENICFIGDSITEGTMNDGVPWYEPLMENFKGKKITNLSKGSYTTVEILKNMKEKIKSSSCDVTIINIGTNDIRYYAREKEIYKENMKEIIKLLDENSKKILLTPWKTYPKDKIIGENKEYKKYLYSEYSKVLKEIAEEDENITFADPNRYIEKAIEYKGEDTYLLDGVHPNNKIGVRLYSFAVLRSA